MIHRATCSLAFALLLIASPAARGIILYDGSLGTAPQDQGWLTYNANTASNLLTVAGGATTLDTTSNNSIQAGFSNYHPWGALVNLDYPSFDRNGGIHLRIDLRINSESPGLGDRAGFSITLLSDDRRGIELGFWNDRIWAQHDSTTGVLFTRGEEALFNTTAGIVQYDLSILGSSYTLKAGGQTILTGALRDYSNWPGFPNPYALPNFVFFGDNTGSAQASATFSHISIVPEPAMAGVLAVAMLLLTPRRRKRPSEPGA